MDTNDKNDSNTKITSVIFRYGIISGISLLAIFLGMKAINLVHIFELRGLNFLAVFFIMYFAIQNYKKKVNGKLGYLPGLLIGVCVSIIGYVILSSFLFFYLKFFDKGFMVYLQQHAPFGSYLTPITSAIVVFMEGSGISMIISFLLMQYLKVEKSDKPPIAKEIQKEEKLKEQEV